MEKKESNIKKEIIYTCIIPQEYQNIIIKNQMIKDLVINMLSEASECKYNDEELQIFRYYKKRFREILNRYN